MKSNDIRFVAAAAYAGRGDRHDGTSAPGRTQPRPPRQRGVVLIVALVMLVVISLVASVSTRNAILSESASGTVRTTELATQAAEIAMRFCERSVAQIVQPGLPAFTTTFTVGNILPAVSATHWQEPAHWDSASTVAYVLPLAVLNDAALRTTYLRAPECMVTPSPVLLPGASTASITASFVVTVRGFGPEVAAGSGRPVGTEIWLQSHIQFE